MTKLKFSELSLSPEMLRAIDDMGFVEASQIQSETIPVLLTGKDVIGQAQTGTGKTAAFGIPMIEAIKAGDKFISSLVVCPTRELAMQVALELRKLAKHKKDIHVLPVYGGESIQNQIRDLRRGVQVIVGTPGRIMDHMNRKTLSFAKVKMVVLDEADEMLNMGFRDDIEDILRGMPADKQTVLFSATMPKPIVDIAHRYQKNPVMVKVTSEKLTNASIEQIYFESSNSAKAQIMSTLMDINDLKLVLVFCNTKRKVDEVVKTLYGYGRKADAIHGDLSQNQRNAVLAKFRKGDINVLVATDVAARGLDINNVDAVFNYDMPLDPEYYVHRIGRTGRAGKTGVSYTFVTGRDEMRRIKAIENYTKVRIERKNVPTEKESLELNKIKLLVKLKTAFAAGNNEKYETMVQEYCKEGFTPPQLAAALLKLTLHKNTPEKPIVVREPREERERPRTYGQGSERQERFSRRPEFRRESPRPRR